MNSLVSRAVGAPPEGSPTHSAFKRLLLSVESLMVFEVGATAEVPPTVSALIESPHHVKIALVMRAEAEVFPVRFLRGGFQSSVNSVM